MGGLARRVERVVRLKRPFRHQGGMIVHPAQFKSTAGGRRMGKTEMGLRVILLGHGPILASGLPLHRGALQGGEIGWLAPNWKTSTSLWESLQNAAGAVAIHQNSELRRMRFAGGGSVQIFSTQQRMGTRSFGLDGIVYDEAAHGDEASWTEKALPALLGRNGWGWMISSPTTGWFQDTFEAYRGTANCKAWRIPTWANPRVTLDELRMLRSILNSRIWRQEILAEFVPPASAVFPELGAWNELYVPAPMSADGVCLGMDPGFRKFAVVHALYTGTDLEVFHAEEIEDKKTDDALAAIKDHPWAKMVRFIAVDPQGAAVQEDSGTTTIHKIRKAFPYAEVRWSTHPSHRSPEWRADRIRDFIRSVDGDVRLYIDPHQAGLLLRMLKRSVYPTNRSGAPIRVEPLKDGETDHLRDALGYLLVNLFFPGGETEYIRPAA